MFIDFCDLFIQKVKIVMNKIAMEDRVACILRSTTQASNPHGQRTGK